MVSSAGYLGRLRRDLGADALDAVFVVHIDQRRLEISQFYLVVLAVGGDDEDVADGRFARGGTVDGDHAATALTADGVGGEAFAVVDIVDLDALVLFDVGGVEKVFVDRARAFVFEFRCGDSNAVELRF